MSKWAVCVLLIAASNAGAWQVERPPDELRKPVEVKGVVKEAGTGQPLEGAMVLLESDEQKVLMVVQTGADGTFSLTSPDSMSTVSVFKPGFQAKDGDGKISLPVLTFRNQPRTVELIRLGAISGRIVDENGEPLVGIRVEALVKTVRNGIAKMSVHAWNPTNDRGEFRLWHLRPGPYWLRALGRQVAMMGFGSFPPFRDEELAYGPLYFPSGQTLSEGQPIQVLSGEAAQADFQLTGRAAYRISGRIVGAPADDPVSVEVYRNGELVGSKVMVNLSSGAFEAADLPPGQYALNARTRSRGRESGEVFVRVNDGDLTGVSLALSEGVEVRGRIVSLANRPAVRSMSLALLPWPGSGGNEKSGFGYRESQVVIPKVPPGRYVVALDRLDVVSIHSGKTDVLEEGLTVTPTGCEPLDITLAAETGTVRLAEGVAENRLVMLLKRQGNQVFSTSFLHHPGTTRTSPELAPGEYRAYLRADGEELEYRNPAVLDLIWSRAAAFSVKAGETVEIVPPVLESDGAGGLK